MSLIEVEDQLATVNGSNQEVSSLIKQIMSVLNIEQPPQNEVAQSTSPYNRLGQICTTIKFIDATNEEQTMLLNVILVALAGNNHDTVRETESFPVPTTLGGPQRI